MELPTTKKSKLEDTTDSSQPTPDVPAKPSVRQQLHDLLFEASTKSCGMPLPAEVRDKIIDYCLFSDFSELPDKAWKMHEILFDSTALGRLELGKVDPLRIDQLTAIRNLPGEPLKNWGSEFEDIIDNEDMEIWWKHVGFPVGWKGSGEMMKFDFWACYEYHHFHGVFVFEKGSTDVLFQTERFCKFCKPVRRPDRAEELKKKCSRLMMD